MEKKYQYIIQDETYGKPSRNTWQRENDMKALTRLTSLVACDGNIEKTRKKPIIDFFYGNKGFKNESLYSKQMQASLITIKKEWKKYRNSPVIHAISDYVTRTLSTTVSETNIDSIFDTVESYYNSDKNRTYFSVEKLLADIAKDEWSEEQQMQAIAEFEEFTSAMAKEVLPEDESV